jgi:hypothetical protein
MQAVVVQVDTPVKADLAVFLVLEELLALVGPVAAVLVVKFMAINMEA